MNSMDASGSKKKKRSKKSKAKKETSHPNEKSGRLMLEHNDLDPTKASKDTNHKAGCSNVSALLICKLDAPKTCDPIKDDLNQNVSTEDVTGPSDVTKDLTKEIDNNIGPGVDAKDVAPVIQPPAKSGLNINISQGKDSNPEEKDTEVSQIMPKHMEPEEGTIHNWHNEPEEDNASATSELKIDIPEDKGPNNNGYEQNAKNDDPTQSALMIDILKENITYKDASMDDDSINANPKSSGLKVKAPRNKGPKKDNNNKDVPSLTAKKTEVSVEKNDNNNSPEDQDADNEDSASSGIKNEVSDEKETIHSVLEENANYFNPITYVPMIDNSKESNLNEFGSKDDDAINTAPKSSELKLNIPNETGPKEQNNNKSAPSSSGLKTKVSAERSTNSGGREDQDTCSDESSSSEIKAKVSDENGLNNDALGKKYNNDAPITSGLKIYMPKEKVANNNDSKNDDVIIATPKSSSLGLEEENNENAPLSSDLKTEVSAEINIKNNSQEDQNANIRVSASSGIKAKVPDEQGPNNNGVGENDNKDSAIISAPMIEIPKEKVANDNVSKNDDAIIDISKSNELGMEEENNNEDASSSSDLNAEVIAEASANRNDPEDQETNRAGLRRQNNVFYNNLNRHPQYNITYNIPRLYDPGFSIPPEDVLNRIDNPGNQNLNDYYEFITPEVGGGRRQRSRRNRNRSARNHSTLARAFFEVNQRLENDLGNMSFPLLDDYGAFTDLLLKQVVTVVLMSNRNVNWDVVAGIQDLINTRVNNPDDIERVQATYMIQSSMERTMHDMYQDYLENYVPQLLR